jgi:hypothetical protein
MPSTEIEKAEATIADLERKRVAANEAGRALADEQAAIAFSAHADGDAKAHKRLDEVNASLAKHGFEVASIDAAIKQAQAKLHEAERAEAQRVDAERQAKAQAVAQRMIERAKTTDAALKAAVEGLIGMKQDVDELHLLGCAKPTWMQFQTMGWLALQTAMGQTQWADRIDPVPPGQRTTFTDFVRAWFVPGAKREPVVVLPQAPQSSKADIAREEQRERAAAAREFLSG